MKRFLLYFCAFVANASGALVVDNTLKELLLWELGKPFMVACVACLLEIPT